MVPAEKPGRIEAFDYLRGYFILVIVIDHLYRWPSFLSIFTGEGLLWSNASDGFIIISGLLVGYIRGYKGLKLPFPELAKKLAKRAGMLYLWGVGVSIVLATIQWLVTFKANMPDVAAPTGNWLVMIERAFTLSYVHPWIYFLHLYAIFLLLAIAAVWLMRHRLHWVVLVLSAFGLFLGNLYAIEWMERQALFFVPVVIGFYLDDIRSAVVNLPRKRQSLLYGGFIGFTATSVVLSVVWRFAPQILDPRFVDLLSAVFSRNPMGLGATLIAFVWFIGLFALIQLVLPQLKRWLGWLVLPFGTRSLAAYVIHGTPILIISWFLPMTTNIWLNTALGVLSVLFCWWLIRVKRLQRILPQ